MRPTRRDFLKSAGAAVAAMGAGIPAHSQTPESLPRPNILFIITDDQGYGDLGCHGNPVIRTPRLDRLYAESVWFDRFHACPVCSPTRACLMTGRYNYRTGVLDTYLGRSMMFPNEITLAEVLRDNGYATGLFGKWHLGDHYPMRAEDQGFAETLTFNGGGMMQPSDFPDNHYFDPMLRRNGVWEKHAGYCTDIFARAAMDFMTQNKDKPFFAYVATNAPHVPLEVAEDAVKPYLDAGVDPDTARAYAMITNIDENVGRMLDHLDALGLAQNTIVIFMTDNGTYAGGVETRYNAGMRGWKGTPYEGGIRVPCFVRWPTVLAPGRDIDRIAAHIDLFPTLLEAAGAPIPDGLRLDGRSLLPLLRGDVPAWPERTLFFQWHRGDAPEPHRGAAVLTQRHKLVEGRELYDLETDPAESHDIAAEHPDLVARLRAEYDAWLADVSATRGFAPPRIPLGTPHENPVVLSRQDWRGPEGWGDQHVGHWEVTILEAGEFDVTLKFPKTSGGTARFRMEGLALDQPVETGVEQVVFRGVALPAGDGRLEAFVEEERDARGVRFVEVARRS